MDKLDNVLSYNDVTITDDARFDVYRIGNKYNLKLTNASTTDAGTYRCIMNTIPMQIKRYLIHVIGMSVCFCIS